MRGLALCWYILDSFDVSETVYSRLKVLMNLFNFSMSEDFFLTIFTMEIALHICEHLHAIRLLYSVVRTLYTMYSAYAVQCSTKLFG